MAARKACQGLIPAAPAAAVRSRSRARSCSLKWCVRFLRWAPARPCCGRAPVRAPRDGQQYGAGGCSGAGRLRGAHGLAHQWSSGSRAAASCTGEPAASPRVGAAAAQVVRLTRAADAAALERCLGTHGLLGVFVDATLACRAAALVRTRARCARTAGNLASCVASRGAACWKLLCLEQACRVRTGHITRQCGVGADRAAACTPPACGVLARVSSAQGA